MVAVILILALFGLVAYAVEHYLPLSPPFKGLVVFLILIAAILFLLQNLAVFHV